jgi:stage II sporulation protein D
MPGKPRVAQEPDIIPASFVANSPIMKFDIDVIKDQALLKLPSKEATEISQAAYLFVPQSENGLMSFNGKLYRGYFLIYPAKEANKFNVVNIVELEDYLLSVVPSEMPSLWPLESLKAQAIAARSYAIANLGKNERSGFDVKATVEDQVYLGVQTETQATNMAVAATEGLVLKYDGKPISAFFHSSSGGWTDLAEFVWSKPVAYLKSVPDFDDASPNFSWERKFVPESIEKAFLANGIDLGQILHFDCPLQSEAGRNRFILVTGSKKAKLVTGEGLRKILNLPSSSFNIGSKEEHYVIAGRGFGHGLGMSQWGAKQLAEHGYNAAQILSYYYKDVNLDIYQ